MTDKILVTGADGLIGSRFVELYPHPDQLICPDLHQLDITDLGAVQTYLRSVSPRVIVNFAAFTDVSAAENQHNDKSKSCWQINVTGVSNLISSIDPAVTHFIHISTDMVFPGNTARPGPYTETDLPETNSDLLPWYGFTKAEAERSLDVHHAAVLRITNPVRAHYGQKLDYFRKPLSLFDAGKLYPLFSDQHVSITFIDDACMALRKIISDRVCGVYHCSSTDMTTPHQVVSLLLSAVRHHNSPLPSTSITSVSNPVRYPQFGGLATAHTQSVLHQRFSTVAEIISALVSQGIAV